MASSKPRYIWLLGYATGYYIYPVFTPDDEVGDLVKSGSVGQWLDFLKILQARADYNFLPVIGNHDVGHKKKQFMYLFGNLDYSFDYGDGLVLKTAANEADIERVAVCLSIAFEEESMAQMCRQLFLYHPNTRLDDLIFVQDETTNEVVSCISLIPWQWHYEDVTLKSGELTLVGTPHTYRRRGLIRAQIDYFKQLLHQRQFDLSFVAGIPDFYPQFGYQYAIPLPWGYGGYRLELHQIPDWGEDETSGFTCRPETAADLPTLKRLYDESAKDLAIHACRDDAIWQYLLEHNSNTNVETASEGWVVLDANETVSGYFRTQKHPYEEETPTTHHEKQVAVCEASRLNYDATLAVLRHLKQLAIQRNKRVIRLALPPNCVLFHGGYLKSKPSCTNASQHGSN